MSFRKREGDKKRWRKEEIWASGVPCIVLKLFYSLMRGANPRGGDGKEEVSIHSSSFLSKESPLINLFFPIKKKLGGEKKEKMKKIERKSAVVVITGLLVLGVLTLSTGIGKEETQT